MGIVLEPETQKHPTRGNVNPNAQDDINIQVDVLLKAGTFSIKIIGLHCGYYIKKQKKNRVKEQQNCFHCGS